MTKEEQQARATLNDHIVIHKVTDNIFAMHKDGTAVYAVDVIRKPLVRCKDCRWATETRFKSIEGDVIYLKTCPSRTEVIDDDDFCSYGERKE